MVARAWATKATSRLCSQMFSLRVLRISPQRLMYFMRESMAKNGYIPFPPFHGSLPRCRGVFFIIL